MKTLFLGISLITFYSCSSVYYYPMENIETKMSRFQAAEKRINFTPDFAVYDFNYKKSSRNIASNQSNLIYKKYSAKSLYVISLVDQFYQFNAYLPNKVSKINSCPQFHSLMVNNDLYKKQYPNSQLQITEKQFQEMINEKNSGLHPEIDLPLSHSERTPKVASQIIGESHQNAKKTVLNALTIHTQKLKDEITALCEFGNSENFYIYSNILEYKNNQQKFQKNKKTAKTLLKTTIISNQVLLSSLNKKSNNKKRGLASTIHNNNQSRPENEVLNRMGTSWFNHYIDQLAKN